MNAQTSKPFYPSAALRPVGSSTAQRIVAVARAHFFAHGFRSVTMDDLAAELGMSKKTLYAEFSSKTALLRAVLLDKFASVEKDLDAVMARCSGDAMAELQQLLACNAKRRSDERRPAAKVRHQQACQNRKQRWACTNSKCSVRCTTFR